MGILELSLVSTRRIMLGFIEFIVACSWDTLLVLLMLLQFVSMAIVQVYFLSLLGQE